MALLGALGAMLALVAPVWAHGDHDARALARGVQAGPYVISLWQVYPDAGDSMAPLLIVMFDGVSALPAADVQVLVDGHEMVVQPSGTTSNGVETTHGVAEGDVVAVTISDAAGTWELQPVVVPPPPTSVIPMPELIYTSIFLTLGTALWLFGRTARAWRRPASARPEPATEPAT